MPNAPFRSHLWIPALLGGLMAVTSLFGAPAWKVRVEESTGLYHRTNDLIRVPIARLGGATNAFTVIDSTGRELPWQIGEGELMFPVSLIPGELPEFLVGRKESPQPAAFKNPVLFRRLGLHRLELGNHRFRVVIDTHLPAIIEAYSLTADPHRQLNLVETTPEQAGALAGDIHATQASGTVADDLISGDNTGWTSLGGSGPMNRVELIENGPCRGRLQLERPGEVWELTWDAYSAALRWKARKGFQLAAVSAAPYVPFDRCVDGSEYNWPTGPGEPEPPNHEVAPRDWVKLPGGHMVYYQHAANYGALGIVALDPDLSWRGAGSRRFLAEKSGGETEIALTFPDWRAGETVLAARQENRLVRQPLLFMVFDSADQDLVVRQPAERQPAVEVKTTETDPAPVDVARLALSGDWELAWSEKGAGPPATGWRTIQVPGSAHTQWLEPEKIYTREAEWVSSKEWWYRRHFRAPESFRGQRLWLQFEAVDYYSDIWINGQFLGHHEGYMDPFEFEVTPRLHAREDNELLVRVWTPVDYYWKHRPYTIKGSYGAVDQKPDDITALGITRPVWLAAREPVFIKDVAIATWLTDDGAEVETQLEFAGESESEMRWELVLTPRNFSAPERHVLTAPVTDRLQRLVLPVKHPQLWWTWDHGKPNLYTLNVRLVNASGQVLDARSLAVGIREIEKVGWTFYLNRRRLFIRGTNYYYHLFMSEMNRAAYARDLGLMLEMNVNLIRLHCHFSNPEFYELADEAGVLLWQDFLEAWYPHDRGFSLRAAELYDPLIRSVRNHPSIALWATSDEEDLDNYADLTKHLAPRPALLDLQRRPVVRSTGRYGDAHVYHGWYDGSIWEYTQMTEDFVSELGATALPNYETLIQFLPNHWPISGHADAWMFRRLQIPEALRAWGDPTGLTLKEYVPRTQAYVARLFQIALERMRRLKYQPAGGILHFHAIDIWPSVTMAAIDFNRKPTAVFNTVRRSFSPVLASLEYDRDRWPTGAEFRCGVWAINDRWEPVANATVSWRILSAPGQVCAQGAWPVTLPADSAQKLGEVSWKTGPPGPHQLLAEVHDAQGGLISENVFQFDVQPRP